VNEAERRLISGDPIPPGVTDPPSQPGKAVPSPGVLPLSTALQNRSIRAFTVQQFLDAGSDVAFVSLIGAYFLQSRGLNLNQTGWLASLPLWGGALGGIAGGALNDILIRSTGNRRLARSLTGCAGKLLGCVLLLLVIRAETAVAAGVLLMGAKFFSDWSQPTTWGACTDIGGRFSATVFSIVNTAGTLGGIVMPLLFGVLLDWFTTKVSSSPPDFPLQATPIITNWNPLFIVLALMYLGSGLCWLFVDCTRGLDTVESPAA
jgi:fucose permease